MYSSVDSHEYMHSQSSPEQPAGYVTLGRDGSVGVDSVDFTSGRSVFDAGGGCAAGVIVWSGCAAGVIVWAGFGATGVLPAEGGGGSASSSVQTQVRFGVTSGSVCGLIIRPLSRMPPNMKK